VAQRQAPGIAPAMRAIRLHAPGDPGRLVAERLPTPRPGAGEALVRVHAAAITRDELDWPADRLPAIPPTSCPAWWPPSAPTPTA
jgi:D-arabinose 1-dehydrogenase-like Zn-dependent alcohol dehydrogenase